MENNLDDCLLLLEKVGYKAQLYYNHYSDGDVKKSLVNNPIKLEDYQHCMYMQFFLEWFFSTETIGKFSCDIELEPCYIYNGIIDSLRIKNNCFYKISYEFDICCCHYFVIITTDSEMIVINTSEDTYNCGKVIIKRHEFDVGLKLLKEVLMGDTHAYTLFFGLILPPDENETFEVYRLNISEKMFQIPQIAKLFEIVDKIKYEDDKEIFESFLVQQIS